MRGLRAAPHTAPAGLQTPAARTGIGWICGLSVIAGAGLILYSQTWAFAWDEGFHLLAAQLVKSGKRPYIDFFHPQTPLYAYWNALWMRLGGEGWRIPHLISALFTAAGALLVGDFVLRRFPAVEVGNAASQARWPIVAGCTSVLFIAVNPLILWYGTIAQPYGLCLFAIVAAFRSAVRAVEDKLIWTAAAGFFAGAAAGASLLTGIVPVVLLVWLLWLDREHRRFRKLAAFLGGALVAFLPVLGLFLQSPRQVFFGAILFHLLYRAAAWPGATAQNLEVMMSWLDSLHALLGFLLAGAGLAFMVSKSGWTPKQKQPFYLCAWLCAGLCGYLCLPHPTFQRYFLFALPFLGALASVGLYAVTARLANPDRPGLALAIVALLLVMGLGKSMYDAERHYQWIDLEQVGRKVNELLPRQESLFADEAIYFLSGHPPPSGMEYHDTHKLSLPPAVAEQLHVVPEPELDQWIEGGHFQMVSICNDTDRVKELGLPGVYRQKTSLQDCDLFWAPQSVR